MADDRLATPAGSDTGREALSLKRAARLLDVHEDTIRRWGKAQKILLIRVGPKLLRVPRSEVVRLRKAAAFCN